ncbi:hypothetical protein [Streptomyces sp. NPDC086787]|uniref:hypothetical protein n=1 Tax=Streptomyces sp. NPDC086787 TaxID=3365759 RepID=UPI003801B7B0
MDEEMGIMSHQEPPGSSGADRYGGGADVSWPTGAISPGTRVTVQDPSWAGPWQVEFEGVIDDLQPPVPVDHAMAYRGELSYWVVFDGPEYDCDGCGPYYKAQIWDRYPAVGTPKKRRRQV